MKKNYFLYAFVALATCLGFSSCSSEEDESAPANSGTFKETRTMITEDEVNDLKVWGNWSETYAIASSQTTFTIKNWEVVSDYNDVTTVVTDGAINDAAKAYINNLEQEEESLDLATMLQIANEYNYFANGTTLTSITQIIALGGFIDFDYSGTTYYIKVVKKFDVYYNYNNATLEGLHNTHNGGSFN